MKTYIDSRLLQKLSSPESCHFKNSFQKLIAQDQDPQFEIEWPTFLNYLGLNSLFDHLIPFDGENPLYIFAVETLSALPEKEIIFDLYDLIFIDCLSQIKYLPQINVSFLLSAIQAKRDAVLATQTWNQFSVCLDEYEQALITDAKQTIHHLILYLAWDRVCVNVAILFDNYKDSKGVESLTILKDCLIESFQHITQQGLVKPSFFRLMEALYAYDLREENLDAHSDAEWAILCKSSMALMPRDALLTISYVDSTCVKLLTDGFESQMFTLEPPEKVESVLSLAKFTMQKLNAMIVNWNMKLSSIKILCLQEVNEELQINEILLS